MNVSLLYKKEYYQLKIHTISVVIYNVGGLRISDQPMKEEHGIWTYETELLPGEYLYKFLVNESLFLFDPSNNLYEQDRDGYLWSLIIIDKDGDRLVNSEQYHLTLTEYKLDLNTSNNRLKGYSHAIESKIVTTINFSEVTGIHGVTGVWYTADETVFEYAETAVCSEEQEQVYVMFWIGQESAILFASEDIWVFRLFIDGILALEDYFLIKNGERIKCKIRSTAVNND